ncbi:hypothetical protein THOM_2947 [Trachipleistophora hominis]|uniref:Uncharacterized protein n=1 Tax=Trachipleistophora hominis TaxID=72359 RepID=L7JSX6_TRAHO|nr:hypothetical protein THOM_2947 [Trachipleistophora hominis]
MLMKNTENLDKSNYDAVPSAKITSKYKQRRQGNLAKKYFCRNPDLKLVQPKHSEGFLIMPSRHNPIMNISSLTYIDILSISTVAEALKKQSINYKNMDKTHNHFLTRKNTSSYDQYTLMLHDATFLS